MFLNHYDSLLIITFIINYMSWLTLCSSNYVDFMWKKVYIITIVTLKFKTGNRQIH